MVVARTFSKKPGRNGDTLTDPVKSDKGTTHSKSRVTIVMAPFESYSAFGPAIDSLYRNTAHPFNLIVIEGNAPDPVREALEKQKKRRRNIRIVYTNHRPNLAESWNLALPHARSKYLFLTDNDLRFTPGWLTHLVNFAQEKNASIVCPYIANDDSDKAISVETPEHLKVVRPTEGPLPGHGASDPSHKSHGKTLDYLKLHGFLIAKKAIEHMGAFDECVSALVTGLDISIKARNHGLPIWLEAKSRLSRDSSLPLQAADQVLFDLQWSSETIGRSLKYVRRKWRITLEEDKYFSWLDRNRQRMSPSRTSFLGNFSYHFQTQVDFAKTHVRRLFEPLTKRSDKRALR